MGPGWKASGGIDIDLPPCTTIDAFELAKLGPWLIVYSFQNMFNVSAIRGLRRKHNVNSTQADGEKEADVAGLLSVPGMDADRLWRETAHQKRLMIKEVRTKVRRSSFQR